MSSQGTPVCALTVAVLGLPSGLWLVARIDYLEPLLMAMARSTPSVLVVRQAVQWLPVTVVWIPPGHACKTSHGHAWCHPCIRQLC